MVKVLKDILSLRNKKTEHGNISREGMREENLKNTKEVLGKKNGNPIRGKNTWKCEIGSLYVDHHQVHLHNPAKK